ncbi:hypothetical protein EVC45_38780 [Paraburkholderia sp. UYCP14C]|nr:hypothetical protein EVC45_38780 [Paraburkholderia sp. UYCP14C]
MRSTPGNPYAPWSIERGLRAMIRHRAAIEHVIGDMKTDGELDQNWPKGALSDATHAGGCAALVTTHQLLRKRKVFYDLVFPSSLAALARSAPGT